MTVCLSVCLIFSSLLRRHTLDHQLLFDYYTTIIDYGKNKFNIPKYNWGRQLGQQQTWVFGGYERQSKQGFVRLVDDWSAAMSIPIIQQVIATRTHIMSDEWGAYQQQMSVGYTHTTVNHSQHFVDPNNGTCTNRIEAYRYAVKRRFKKMYVTVKQMAPSYLDKHMWLFCRRYVILLRGI